MDKTFNVVISSKNKLANDTNSSVSVKLKEDIYVSNDEELTICLQSFNMIKSFYACQNGLNNYFQVILKLPGISTPIETYDRYLSEGNYNVNTLMAEIKLQTNNALFDISYDQKLNKYLYKNLFQPTFEVYIKPITAGIFFGFENGVEYKILPSGTYSSKFINISGYTHLIIKISGDINIENTVSNIYTNDYQFDKILGIIGINDVAPMDSIVYEENSSGMFKHQIANEKISSFSIQIVNENGVVFPQMTDWLCVLKFEKTKNVNAFENIESILTDINYYLASMYSYFEIPSRITYNDLIPTNEDLVPVNNNVIPMNNDLNNMQKG